MTTEKKPEEKTTPFCPRVSLAEELIEEMCAQNIALTANEYISRAKLVRAAASLEN